MFRQTVTNEVKVGERIYRLFCEQDAPVEDVMAALVHWKNECLQIIAAAQKAEEEKNKQEAEKVAQPQ